VLGETLTVTVGVGEGAGVGVNEFPPPHPTMTTISSATAGTTALRIVLCLRTGNDSGAYEFIAAPTLAIRTAISGGGARILARKPRLSSRVAE
jgi:hypothetical protein